MVVFGDLQISGLYEHDIHILLVTILIAFFSNKSILLISDVLGKLVINGQCHKLKCINGKDRNHSSEVVRQFLALLM
jgi:hypothetical protein